MRNDFPRNNLGYFSSSVGASVSRFKSEVVIATRFQSLKVTLGIFSWKFNVKTRVIRCEHFDSDRVIRRDKASFNRQVISCIKLQSRSKRCLPIRNQQRLFSNISISHLSVGQLGKWSQYYSNNKTIIPAANASLSKRYVLKFLFFFSFLFVQQVSLRFIDLLSTTTAFRL